VKAVGVLKRTQIEEPKMLELRWKRRQEGGRGRESVQTCRQKTTDVGKERRNERKNGRPEKRNRVRKPYVGGKKNLRLQPCTNFLEGQQGNSNGYHPQGEGRKGASEAGNGPRKKNHPSTGEGEGGGGLSGRLNKDELK